MDIHFDVVGHSTVAVLENNDVLIETTQDALDLMASVRQLRECDKLIIKKECLSEEFFTLPTGLAGEILQKYTNYAFKVAIIGDFSAYNSRSLNDFIYECNNGVHVFFLPDESIALKTLHQI